MTNTTQTETPIPAETLTEIRLNEGIDTWIACLTWKQLHDRAQSCRILGEHWEAEKLEAEIDRRIADRAA